MQKLRQNKGINNASSTYQKVHTSLKEQIWKISSCWYHIATMSWMILCSWGGKEREVSRHRWWDLSSRSILTCIWILKLSSRKHHGWWWNWCSSWWHPPDRCSSHHTNQKTAYRWLHQATSDWWAWRRKKHRKWEGECWTELEQLWTSVFGKLSSLLRPSLHLETLDTKIHDTSFFCLPVSWFYNWIIGNWCPLLYCLCVCQQEV